MQNRRRDTDVQNRLLDSVEKARVGCFERTASKHVYYLGWNRSPAQVGCMRQVLRPGALGRPRGIGWRGRWEWGSGWGIHVTSWLIHVNVWQNPLQYCVISIQLIKINLKKKYLFHPRPLLRLPCLAFCYVSPNSIIGNIGMLYIPGTVLSHYDFVHCSPVR